MWVSVVKLAQACCHLPEIVIHTDNDKVIKIWIQTDQNSSATFDSMGVKRYLHNNMDLAELINLLGNGTFLSYCLRSHRFLKSQN